MTDRYEPASFEAKWRVRWAEAELFRTRTDPERPKFYGLDFFPFPSGAGLSVGHCRNYVLTDALCRLKAMQGFNVLHPMGFDSFGLPAENEAIKRKTHPATMIERYAANYRRQMDLVGISYDWSRSFKSSDPSYYRWTQWIFEILQRRGLAYRQLAAVNWDPVDKTVLANEEVIGGRAERSGAIVERRHIAQWFFRITAYAQRLLDGLDALDWPEGIKAQQRNWIGRSEGVEFTMRVAREGPEPGRYDLDSNESGFERNLAFDVFTTRVDTLFGVTFCVLAPEHPLVAILPISPEARARVDAYVAEAGGRSEAERTAERREKSGVFTGAHAINPATGAHVPIWIADYVLATYGTGAIMAVPAHDERDFEFAVQFRLPIVPVFRPDATFLDGRSEAEYLADPASFGRAFVASDATLINSGEHDGVPGRTAAEGIADWIEAHGIGRRKVTYRLRDWLISRQRYWGCPIPVIETVEGDEELVPESLLPVELPMVEAYEPGDDGSSPLARIPEFVNVTDSQGRLGRRETDTMGGFACSSWYFLRFTDPHNPDAAWSREAADYWMPVDTYVGGAEHAVLHLLYARFWTMVLHDEGLVRDPEPFRTLRNQGQVLGLTPYRKPRADERLDLGEDGILVSFAEAERMEAADEGDELVWRWARMSKSRGNVVTPDEAVEAHGADALRIALLFRAPYDADIQWESDSMRDAARFLSRVFRFFSRHAALYDHLWRDAISFRESGGAAMEVRRATHRAIRAVTEDVESFAFNTYVSELMKFLNELNRLSRVPTAEESDVAASVQPGEELAWSEAMEAFLLLLAPAAPHTADELWEGLGRAGFTFQAKWPTFDASLATEERIEIAVQVNGKVRDRLETAPGRSEAELREAALTLPKVRDHLAGKTVRKVIVVPDRIVNVVAN